MQAEIIISQGHITLSKPLYLKPSAPIRYVVEIPDDAVAHTRDWLPEQKDSDFISQPVEASPSSLQERYNQILGRMARTRPAASIGDDIQTLQDALEERVKYNSPVPLSFFEYEKL